MIPIHSYYKVHALNLAQRMQDDRLMDAVQSGNKKEVQKILKDKSINVNFRYRYGNTALMLASFNGHAKIVKLLLKFGADVNIQGNNGWNALDCASITNQSEIVKLLLNHGADVNIQDDKGLAWARENGYQDVVKLLQDYKTTQNEYLLYKEERIKELNRELTNILRTSSFPEVLIDTVKSYSSNDFMNFSQFLEQKEKKNANKESNLKVSQGCTCVVQ